MDGWMENVLWISAADTQWNLETIGKKSAITQGLSVNASTLQEILSIVLQRLEEVVFFLILQSGLSVQQEDDKL